MEERVKDIYMNNIVYAITMQMKRKIFFFEGLKYILINEFQEIMTIIIKRLLLNSKHKLFNYVFWRKDKM